MYRNHQGLEARVETAMNLTENVNPAQRRRKLKFKIGDVAQKMNLVENITAERKTGNNNRIRHETKRKLNTFNMYKTNN